MGHHVLDLARAHLAVRHAHARLGRGLVHARHGVVDGLDAVGHVIHLSLIHISGAKISAPTNKRKAAMLWDETPMAEMPFTKIPMLPHISAAIKMCIRDRYSTRRRSRSSTSSGTSDFQMAGSLDPERSGISSK